MKIHEYQGKAILKGYGVPVPRGIVARSADEAEAAARELGTDVVVVKAQIHAGGRGKGGGVKIAKSPEEARQLASEILGMTLVIIRRARRPRGQYAAVEEVSDRQRVLPRYHSGSVSGVTSLWHRPPAVWISKGC